MENIVISKLEKKDVKGAAKLIDIVYCDMIQKREEIFIPKKENFEDYLLTRLQDENFVIVVATFEGKLVGVCEAEIKHLGDNIETRIRDILFIDYIAVDEAYKRQGIGTKLLDYMKKVVKEKHIQSLELNVWGFNESAIEFYEACGMTKKRIVYEFFENKE